MFLFFKKIDAKLDFWRFFSLLNMTGYEQLEPKTNGRVAISNDTHLNVNMKQHDCICDCIHNGDYSEDG